MTGNDEFRRQLARTLFSIRRLSERLRSLPLADQLRRLPWFRQQQEQARSWQELIHEAELEEQREQAGIRQEPVLLAQDPPPESELKEASPSKIETAILDVYLRTGEGQGPNVNDIIAPVQALLKERGSKTSGRRIRELAEGEQFAKYRRQSGLRRRS